MLDQTEIGFLKMTYANISARPFTFTYSWMNS